MGEKMRDVDIIPIKEASNLCGFSRETLEQLDERGKLRYEIHP